MCSHEQRAYRSERSNTSAAGLSTQAQMLSGTVGTRAYVYVRSYVFERRDTDTSYSGNGRTLSRNT